MQSQVNQVIEEKRTCPVCGSTRTGAVYNGRTRIEGEQVDKGGCGCSDCGARWQELYFRRSGRTVNQDVKPGTVRQPVYEQVALAFPNGSERSARPFEHHPGAWYRVGPKDALGLTQRERTLTVQLRVASEALGPLPARHGKRKVI